MMTRSQAERELLAGVLANVSDDAPRYVLADWYLEQGELRGDERLVQRGQFIRLSCDMEKAKNDGRTSEACQLEGELIALSKHIRRSSPTMVPKTMAASIMSMRKDYRSISGWCFGEIYTAVDVKREYEYFQGSVPIFIEFDAFGSFGKWQRQTYSEGCFHRGFLCSLTELSSSSWEVIEEYVLAHDPILTVSFDDIPESLSNFRVVGMIRRKHDHPSWLFDPIFLFPSFGRFYGTWQDGLNEYTKRWKASRPYLHFSCPKLPLTPYESSGYPIYESVEDLRRSQHRPQTPAGN